MKTTFILTLAAAAFSSMQAYAADPIELHDGDGFAYYRDNYTAAEQAEMVLQADSITLIADTGGKRNEFYTDVPTSFEGTLAIDGAVTLQYNDFYGETLVHAGQTVRNTLVDMFSIGSLTFGDGASLTIELSDTCLDVLLNDAYVCYAEWDEDPSPRSNKAIAVLFSSTVKGENEGQITLGASTLSRLAERGLQLEAYDGSQNPYEEGHGVYFINDATIMCYAGAPSQISTPEPATASLSLLALAALASRRRRH